MKTSSRSKLLSLIVPALALLIVSGCDHNTPGASSTTSNWLPIKDATVMGTTATAVAAVPAATAPAPKKNYLTLTLEGAQVDPNANFWTVFLASKNNVVIKVDMPVPQFAGTSNSVVVTTPSIKIQYNQVQQLGQRLSLLYKIPAAAGPIKVKSSLLRTADDGVAAALNQLSGEATSLGVSSSAAATPIAALQVVKTLVDEIVTKDLNAEELPSTYTIIPGDRNNGGVFAVFACDSSNKTNWDKYTSNPSNLIWDGNRISYQDASNPAQKLDGVSYFVFGVSYSDSYYPNTQSIINSKTVYGTIYQQIESVIIARVDDTKIAMLGTKPDAAAITKATQDTWAAIKPLYAAASDAVKKDNRLCEDDAANYPKQVQEYFLNYTHSEFSKIADQIWAKAVAESANKSLSDPMAKSRFVNAFAKAGIAGLQPAAEPAVESPQLALKMLSDTIKASDLTF